MQLGGSRPQGQREKEPWLGGLLQLLTPYHPIWPGLVAWLPGCVSRGCHPDTHGSQKGVFASGPFKCVQLGTERPRPRAMTGHPLVNVRPGGGMDKGWMLLLVIWGWGWGCTAWKRPCLSCPSILCPSGEDLGHSPSKLRPPSSVSEPQRQGVPVVHPLCSPKPAGLSDVRALVPGVKGRRSNSLEMSPA